MGSALAALGLLTRCGWDDDSSFFPDKLGSYLRVDTQLLWIAETEAATLLPVSVRSICSSPWGMVSLSANGETLYIFEGTRPKTVLNLGEPCSQVQSFFEKPALCLACPSGIRIARSPAHSFSPTWETLSETQGFTMVAAASSFIVASDGVRLAAYEPQRFAKVAATALPGPLINLWIEHPTDASGTWRSPSGQEGSFRYRHFARLFTYDTTSRERLKLNSPYLKRSLGTEYLGTVEITLDSILLPGGHSPVKSASADFLNGDIYFLRRDTVWRYNIRAPAALSLIGIFRGAQEIEGVSLYRYGSAEVTMR
ncbi:MAG: hypothetical protein N3E49_09330 [Bacteroidia bacterium]|nr:hypothetical protein [Bacteroidia bacterium]